MQLHTISLQLETKRNSLTKLSSHREKCSVAVHELVAVLARVSGANSSY